MSRIFIIIAVFCSFRGYSQFGFKAVSTFPKNRIAQISTGNKLFPFISGLGVDYWFRLKNYRLEFLPAVHFQYGHERLDLDQNIEGVLNWSVIDFVPSVQFYPLDFFNDCSCPTFSKQGEFLKKGLFINITPGVALSRLSSKQTSINAVNETILFGRAGVGLDIGLSNLLTISPSVSYQVSQRLDWSDLFVTTTSNTLNIYSGVFVNLRVGMRLDKKNY